MKNLLLAALMVILRPFISVAQNLVQKWLHVSGSRGCDWDSDAVLDNVTYNYSTDNLKNNTYLCTLPLTSSFDFDIFIIKHDRFFSQAKKQRIWYWKRIDFKRIKQEERTKPFFWEHFQHFASVK